MRTFKRNMRSAGAGIDEGCDRALPVNGTRRSGVSEFLCKRDGLQLTQIRSPNSMVNRFSAAFQSRIGMLHFWLMLRKAR